MDTRAGAASVAPPPSPRARRMDGLFAVVWPSPRRYHYASLGVGFFGLLFLTRHQWFFFDEWDFLLNYGPLSGTRLSLFAPHNEHWSTLPVLVYHALQALFGLRSYLPYMVVLAGLHVGAAHLLWRLMLRHRADPWIATGLGVVFLALGAAYEDLIWAFQIGFVGSVTLGLIAVTVTDRPDRLMPRWQAVEWTASIGALMCSGIGVTTLAVVTATALVNRGVGAAARTLSVPSLVFALWFLLIGRHGISSGHGSTDLLLLPAYVWRALTNAIEVSTGLAHLGALGVISLIFWTVTQMRQSWRWMSTPIAMSLGAVLFFTQVGYGRLYLGVDESTASRYVYIAIALLLPLVATALTGLIKRLPPSRWVAYLLLGFAVVHGTQTLRAQAQAGAGVKQESRGQILAAAQLLSQGVRVVAPQPDPQWAPNLTPPTLADLVAQRSLPPATGLTSKDFLNGRYGLQVLWGGTPTLAVSAASVTLSTTSDGGRAGGCVQISRTAAAAGVELDFAAAASVIITTPNGGDVALQLGMRNDPSSRSDPHPHTLGSNTPTYLNVAQAGAFVVLRWAAATVQICGVRGP